MTIHLIIRTFNEEYKGTISEDKSTLATLQRIYKRDDQRHSEASFCHPTGTLFFCHYDPIRRANFRLRLSPNITDLKPAPDFYGDLRIFEENSDICNVCIAIKAYCSPCDEEPSSIPFSFSEEEEESAELH